MTGRIDYPRLFLVEIAHGSDCGRGVKVLYPTKNILPSFDISEM